VLLLEEIFEGLAGVVVAWRGGRKASAYASDGRILLGIRRGRGVFFNRGPEFVKFAVVASVLGSDALGDMLRALKLGGGVEEAALLAAVEFKVALGTFSVGIEAGV
jgi:hypothetical protein